MNQSAQGPIQPSEQYCPEPGHHLSPKLFFCEADQCRKAICSVCVVKYHRHPKVHKVIEIGEAIVKRKSNFQNLLSSLNNKISSITKIHAELQNNIELLSQRQTKFKLTLEDTCRQRIDAINTNKDKLLKIYDVAYYKEKDRALEVVKNLGSFIDNALEYTRCLVLRIDSQPYLLDETTEMKIIQEILDYTYENQTQSSVLEDIESDLPSADDSLCAVCKAFPNFVSLKKCVMKHVCSGLAIMHFGRYMTALLITVTAAFLSMSLILCYNSDQVLRLSRSDQFPCLVVDDNSTDFWSAEQTGKLTFLFNYDSNNGTRIQFKSGNGTTITHSTLSSVNMQPIFTVYQSQKNLATLSANSSERFIDFCPFNRNNGTRIQFKSGNGTTITHSTVSSVNMQPIFTIYQSEKNLGTLSANSSERFIDFCPLNRTDPKPDIKAHNMIFNTSAWTSDVLNSTVSYIFASSVNFLVENSNEIDAAQQTENSNNIVYNLCDFISFICSVLTFYQVNLVNDNFREQYMFV